MKNVTSLKIKTLGTPKSLPRKVQEAELKALVGGRRAESSGGTSSSSADSDE